MTNTEAFRQRVRSVRAALTRKHLDALIVSSVANTTYLTGFFGHDSWAVVTSRTVYLVTDSRYTEQARKECVQTTIVERRGPMAEAISRLLGRRKSVAAVGIEDTAPISAHTALRKRLKVRLKPVDGVVEQIRPVKDTRETRAIRTAASIAAAALRTTRRRLRPGVTESELAGLLDLEIRRLGAENSFETIVAFGANASRPHHQPTMRRLRQKDTILIDFGARYKGYSSDITRCFAVGKPSKPYRHAFETVEKAQAAAIGLARAGARLVDVDAAAREVIRRCGLPVYRHGTGHGLGLEIHEKPFLKEKAEGELQAGQIITIEPGVYIPGTLGVRIEDDIRITETGCEIITRKCPHTPLPE
jgi:Xaa-Pro aminopeptidase